MRTSIAACGSPAGLSRLEEHDALALGALIFGQKARCRCARNTAADDDKVGFGGELGGGAVAEEELIGLAVPKG